jgi:hypothetical protein
LLSILDVSSKISDDIWRCEVTINIEADRDYELFTELGYKTTNESDWKIIPLHFTKRGERMIKFDSELKPDLIKLDPFYRIPHIAINKIIWTKPSAG